MTTRAITERTVPVKGKDIFVAETGSGPAVVLLHGGGPGASGVSNYARNIEPLAENFRVIVPDMPGYGRSAKGVDRRDPFGYLADHIRGMLDALGIDRRTWSAIPTAGRARCGWPWTPRTEWTSSC